MSLILFSDKYEKMYNCSFYNYEDKPYRDRSNPFFGWLYLFTAAIIWILYIPCVIVMLKKDFIKYPCYKLMVFLAILDLNLTIYTGFWAGIINITGNVYCHWPKAAFIMGLLHAGAWKPQTTSTVVLALNRCLESISTYYAEILFNGKRIYFWMCFPLALGIQDIILGPPAIFSPLYSALTYNPHEGYFLDAENKYTDDYIFHYNLFIVFLLVLIYGTFVIYLFLKSKNARSTARNAKVFGQILLISLFLFMVIAFFSVTQYNPLPTFFYPWFSYSFILLHGLPPIIYLTLNKTMRKNIFKMLGISKYFERSVILYSH